MEINRQKVKHHLMETDEEFSRLANEHSFYEKKLEGLSQRSHLSADEQFEEVNLKKRKLSIKDQMERKIQMYLESQGSLA